ncbi:hypothetical protein KA405_00955 [Patescibacteria group bacterium]|nr:hypothetical protein [Patescibacteria group bacterium]
MVHDLSFSTYSSPFSSLIFASMSAFCSDVIVEKSIFSLVGVIVASPATAAPNHALAAVAPNHPVRVAEVSIAADPEKPALSHLLLTFCVYFSPWIFFCMKQ